MLITLMNLSLFDDKADLIVVVLYALFAKMVFLYKYIRSVSSYISFEFVKVFFDQGHYIPYR